MSRHEEDEDERYYVIEEKGGGAGSFLLGAVIGAGIALLLAPQSGVETRRDIKRKARQVSDAAKDAAGDLQDTVVDRYSRARALRWHDDRFGASGDRPQEAPGDRGDSRGARGGGAGARGARGATRGNEGGVPGGRGCDAHHFAPNARHSACSARRGVRRTERWLSHVAVDHLTG